MSETGVSSFGHWSIRTLIRHSSFVIRISPLLFSKLLIKQLRQRGDCRVGIGAFGGDRHLSALLGGEDDHLHHALSIGLAGLGTTFDHGDVACELVRHIHELHGRSGVQAKRVLHDDITNYSRHESTESQSSTGVENRLLK
jgi:hypothetical protein